MSRMTILTAVGLTAALAACGPAPEEEGDAAPVAQVAPDPESTQQVAEEATATPPAATPDEQPRPRRDR